MFKPGYDQATKDAIVTAVTEARKSGKKWKLAFEAGEKAGYKGTLGGLVQFVRTANLSAKKQRGPAAKATKAKRGRPKGVKTAAAKPQTGTFASQIEALVKAQVNAALERAIAVLRSSI